MVQGKVPPHKARKSQKTTQSVPLFGDVLERVHAQIQLLEVTQHCEIPWKLHMQGGEGKIQLPERALENGSRGI